MNASSGQIIKSSGLVRGSARLQLPAAGAAPVAPCAATEPRITMTAAELESLQLRAKAEGYADALDEARKRAVAEAAAEMQTRLAEELSKRAAQMDQDHAEKLRSLAVALADQLAGLRGSVQAQVTEWAMVAITRVLGRALAKASGVEAVVHQVLLEAGLEGPVSVLVHRSDLEGLRKARQQDPDLWPESIEFKADARVQLGGCLIESPMETIDASLEVQLAILRELLNKGRHV